MTQAKDKRIEEVVKIYLPDADHAKRMGWKFHIQWSDPQTGNTCFYRRKTLHEAQRDCCNLTSEGALPFVVDAFTGEIVNVG